MINLSSTTQMSLLFFGGTIKTKEPRPVLNELGQPTIIKTGKNRGEIKTKLEIIEKYCSGLGISPDADWLTKKKGIYQTNEKVLNFIVMSKVDDEDKLIGPKAKQIAAKLLELRGLQKLMGTYYQGVDKFIDTDSCLHQNINHTSTATGRLSSNKPNLENVVN